MGSGRERGRRERRVPRAGQRALAGMATAAALQAVIAPVGAGPAAPMGSPPDPGARRGAAPGLISINFGGVELRQALTMIANYAKANIVITPGATGMVSINLQNQPADAAIRLVG